jgi:haloalkane dehalogenase
MIFLRTPDECFNNLPEYPFLPNYITVDDYEGGELRMHYLDEGDRNAAPILLLHGEPSWSFLYRKMIPGLVAAGHRVIAPDLIGFGRSDKPTEQKDYTYERHVGWIVQLITKLTLEKITLFAQDWGGLVGLRVIAENEQRFSRVCIGNTALPIGDTDLGKGFQGWKRYSQTAEEFIIGDVIALIGGMPELPEEIRAGYSAPFPDESFKAGARIFPMLVPDNLDNPACEANMAAWRVLEKWQKPFLTVFAENDFTYKQGVHLDFQERIPGAKGQSHITFKNCAHFFQEQIGPILTNEINRFIVDNPS